MGLELEYIDYIADCVTTQFGDFQGKNMLELGNQVIGKSAGRIKESTGKDYYTSLGCHHVSIDLNEEDGALPIDLSKLIDKPEWTGHFDIITNSGTTEHVEPYETQYECFANLHNWLKVGGIAVHIVPDIDELNRRGRWRNHCNNYYSQTFFQALADNNNYRVYAPKYIRQLACVCLIKKKDVPFMSDREAFLEHIARLRGGTHYVGINDAGFTDTPSFYERARAFKHRLLRRQPH